MSDTAEICPDCEGATLLPAAEGWACAREKCGAVVGPDFVEDCAHCGRPAFREDMRDAFPPCDCRAAKIERGIKAKADEIAPGMSDKITFISC